MVTVAAGHEGRHRVADGRSGRRRASSSCCSPTTRSTARCATRAASARCRTRRSATARARAATSRRSGTTRSRSRSATSCYLDRERCILCDRCTRFADEVAGDPLIHFIDRGNQTQVNTFPDEPFASYFSGNTVQICPVGALTAKPYRFKARPWDLERGREHLHRRARSAAASSCSRSRDEVLRYQGVDSDPVNWGWLCDQGRFNFEAVEQRRAAGRSRSCAHGDELVADHRGTRRSTPPPR